MVLYFLLLTFSKVISCKKEIRGLMTRLQETKSKLVEQSEDLAEVCFYSLMVLIIRDSCSRSITDQVWNSSRPLAWLFRKADAFRVTWSEQVCVCEVVSDLSLKGIDREGLEKGRAETRPVKNISDHFSYGKRKLFMLKVAGLRETWKMTASVFLPDAKTKTSWPLETCSIKGCWFAMIVFCICVILHSMFIHWVSL